MSSALDRLKVLTNKISSFETARKENMQTLKELYSFLKIDEKISNFEDLFQYKAMNVTGLSLQAEDLGAIKENRYVQIICIAYDKEAKGQKSKNSSLGYFGRSDVIEEGLKKAIVKFILAWRFEKSFMTLEHYHDMIHRVNNEAIYQVLYKTLSVLGTLGQSNIPFLCFESLCSCNFNSLCL